MGCSLSCNFRRILKVKHRSRIPDKGLFFNYVHLCVKMVTFQQMSCFILLPWQRQPCKSWTSRLPEQLAERLPCCLSRFPASAWSALPAASSMHLVRGRLSGLCEALWGFLGSQEVWPSNFTVLACSLRLIEQPVEAPEPHTLPSSSLTDHKRF